MGYDAKVRNTSAETGEFPTWDFYVVGGICPLITGDEEAEQRAAVCAFTQYGAIPQLPEVGVDWTGFFTKKLSFADLDAAVRTALQDSELDDFYPSYETDSGKVICVIKEDDT
jgi:hypothetical protein